MVDIFGLLSFLGGVVAGAGGSFGGRYLWSVYTKPKLEFDWEADSVALREEKGDSIQMVASIFRVSVTNNGKTAATNCRPRIHLKCTDMPSPVEKHWEPPDPEELPEDIDPEDVAKPTLEDMKFEIDTALVWSEGSQPSRITINADETVSFDLLMVDQRNRNTAEERLYKVKFPSEQGWDRPAKFYTQHDRFAELPQDATGITRYQLANADWDLSYVEVTGENCDKITGDLRFSDEHGWVQITVDQRV